MAEPCDYAKVHIKIDAEFEIAPIQTSHIMQPITNILKEVSELQRYGCKNIVLSQVTLDYIPVRDEDLPKKKCER